MPAPINRPTSITVEHEGDPNDVRAFYSVPDDDVVVELLDGVHIVLSVYAACRLAATVAGAIRQVPRGHPGLR